MAFYGENVSAKLVPSDVRLVLYWIFNKTYISINKSIKDPFNKNDSSILLIIRENVTKTEITEILIDSDTCGMCKHVQWVKATSRFCQHSHATVVYLLFVFPLFCRFCS